jgi:hypothetical protein
MKKWTRRLAVGLVALALLIAAQPAMAQEPDREPGLGEFLEKYGGVNGLAQALISQGMSSEEAQAILIAVQRTMQANDLADRTANQLSAQQFNEWASQAETQSVHELLQSVHQLTQAARNQAREQRAQEANAQANSLQQAAEDLRKAAESRLEAHFTTMDIQIGQGLAAMVNRSASMSRIPVSGALQPDADRRMPSWDQIMSEAAEGMARNDREPTERAREHASELMDQMMDLIRDIRDKLGAIEQSRVETNRGIARDI